MKTCEVCSIFPLKNAIFERKYFFCYLFPMKYLLLLILLIPFSGIAQDISTTKKEPSLQNLKSSEKIKDSLFFHLNESYFQKGKYDENLLYSKDALKDEGSSETFLFKIMERRSDIAAPEKIGSFHQYITGSEFFQEEKKVNKLQDYRLASHLQKFIIYLVDYNYEPPIYIQVYPLTEIE